MGGGSSDAAACLLALNRLWKLKLSTRQLAQIGLSLGADVPFFLAGQNAWVEGIGERITPVHIPATRFVVVKPVEGVDTSAIFSSPELKRDSKPATISGFAADPFAFGCNDLQPVATKHCPDVARALDWLGASGLPGRMTGSGSAVFAQLLDGVDLDGAPEAWRIRTCSTLEAHPLRGWASSDG